MAMNTTVGFDVSSQYEYSVIGIRDDEAEKVAMAGSSEALKSMGRTIIIRTFILDESPTV